VKERLGHFSELDSVTDLVYAAYVEKPTMAETVEPNARMLKNTLDAASRRTQRPTSSHCARGWAKSYGFSLGCLQCACQRDPPRLIAPIHYHQQEDITTAWSEKNGASWTGLASSPRDWADFEFSDEPCARVLGTYVRK